MKGDANPKTIRSIAANYPEISSEYNGPDPRTSRAFTQIFPNTVSPIIHRIIGLLEKYPDLTVTEITKSLGLTRRVSRYLNIMKERGQIEISGKIRTSSQYAPVWRLTKKVKEEK